MGQLALNYDYMEILVAVSIHRPFLTTLPLTQNTINQNVFSRLDKKA
jgi:hypothetical protein